MFSTFFISVVGGVGLLTAVGMSVVAAFNLGKRRGLTGKSPRFGKIASQLRLDDTEWQLTYDIPFEDGKETVCREMMHFRQMGSRLVGEGKTANGDACSLEGTSFGRQICFIFLNRQGKSHNVGTVIAGLNADGSQMTGTRALWSQKAETLEVRKISLTRQE